MPKRLPLIIGAVVLAFMAVILVNKYLEQRQQVLRVQTKEELTRMQEMQGTVVLATRDIPKAAVIGEGMLEIRSIPKEYIQPQAVSYPERIVGMVTAVPMAKGEQVTLTKLVSAKQATASSLAMATPVGKRAVSISVDNISSLMGMIKPGDYVDVIGFIPVPAQTPEGKQATQMAVMPLFQNVLVLAVGRDLGAAATELRYRREEDSAGSSPLITLAFSPQEANLIAFVTEQGKIRLVLRSPADSRIEPIQPASWETLFQYLMPQLPLAAKDEAETQLAAQEKPRPREIEIYRGLKREKIPVYDEHNP